MEELTKKQLIEIAKGKNIPDAENLSKTKLLELLKIEESSTIESSEEEIIEEVVQKPVVKKKTIKELSIGAQRVYRELTTSKLTATQYLSLFPEHKDKNYLKEIIENLETI